MDNDVTAPREGAEQLPAIPPVNLVRLNAGAGSASYAGNVINGSAEGATILAALSQTIADPAAALTDSAGNDYRLVRYVPGAAFSLALFEAARAAALPAGGTMTVTRPTTNSAVNLWAVTLAGARPVMSDAGATEASAPAEIATGPLPAVPDTVVAFIFNQNTASPGAWAPPFTVLAPGPLSGSGAQWLSCAYCLTAGVEGVTASLDLNVAARWLAITAAPGDAGAPGPPLARAWDGTAWREGPLRGWDGARWAPVRAHDGARWIEVA